MTAYGAQLFGYTMSAPLKASFMLVHSVNEPPLSFAFFLATLMTSGMSP
jgi:hypothetical protein